MYLQVAHQCLPPAFLYKEIKTPKKVRFFATIRMEARLYFNKAISRFVAKNPSSQGNEASQICSYYIPNNRIGTHITVPYRSRFYTTRFARAAEPF